MLRLRLERRASPVGEALIVTDQDGALRALDFAEFEARMRTLLKRHYGEDFTLEDGPAPPAVAAALDAYFQGDLEALSRLPAATGGSQFQRAVWAALRTVAPGVTASYGQIAKQVGAPKASRAVGLANGSNPIAIAVPCHRVIGANGGLTGYAGGLERKKWLLEHEARHTRSAA